MFTHRVCCFNKFSKKCKFYKDNGNTFILTIFYDFIKFIFIDDHDDSSTNMSQRKD